ncbi:hypothetical protein MN116_003550 [Schistosoma mekongi]|uniref:Uncharacterized protein n=1 Tax=Schistosoma mekongi TaxID=38744 RepID=A0AAE1ZFE2_SCHME|nr:hypothetical protein MN116_003550 [Schistosoma mekongi]
MPVSVVLFPKFKKERVRSLSELSPRRIYLKDECNETEPCVHLSCYHHEDELNYLRQQLTVRTEEAEKIASELTRVKDEGKQFDDHLHELTRDGSAKADTIIKLKEKVSELYVEVESLRCCHLQAICHQKDLQNEIDNLKCSRDWYADQLRLVQCVRDRIQNEPERISNLLKDSSEINHRLAHENACLQAQLACSRAALADAKRNLSRQLESIHVDMIEREAIFERITAERASFENISRQRADEIIELQSQVSNLQMELKSTEEHLLHQKNKLLDAEEALAVAESRRSELQNQLDTFEREHFSKENCLDDRISKYNIILESFEGYENGHSSKGILLNEILEERATLTAALSASQHEKETLNNYLVNLKDNLIKVEESFAILRREIASKSTQILELTGQRDSMADKLKTLYDQLGDYWRVIENLRQEKQELNTSLKVLQIELKSSHNNLNELKLSLQKSDVGVQTVIEVQPMESSPTLPNCMINRVPAFESQVSYHPSTDIVSFKSQPITVSLLSPINNFSTSDAISHSSHITIDKSYCWQALSPNKTQVPICQVSFRDNLSIVAPVLPESNYNIQNSIKSDSQENYHTTPLSTDQNIFGSMDQSSLISINVSSTSYKRNQMKSDQPDPNSNKQRLFGNCSYTQQLQDSQNSINFDSGFQIPDAHMSTSDICAFNNQQCNMPQLNIHSQDNQNDTYEYESNIYQDNLYAPPPQHRYSSIANCDITTSQNRISLPSISSPLDLISISANCDNICSHRWITSKETDEKDLGHNFDQIPPQSICLSNKKDSSTALSIEQDLSYKCTIVKDQNLRDESFSYTNDHDKVNKNKASVKLAEYFSCAYQENGANEIFHVENVATSSSPDTEALSSTPCSFPSYKNSNLIHSTEGKAVNAESYEIERSDHSPISSKQTSHEYFQPSSTSKTPNGLLDKICSTSQFDINAYSSEHVCCTSEAYVVPTFDELNHLKSELNTLSEYVSVLQKDLAEAVANSANYQKEAEVHALNIEREKVAHRRALEAHQLTELELNNTKAELAKMEKLVVELRREVVSSKEEVALFQAREEENRSLHETEISSMQSVVTITSYHLSTLAESLENALDEKAILQAELDSLKHEIRDQLRKFSLFTHLPSHSSSKIVDRHPASSLAALGINLNDLENLADGNSETTFCIKSPHKLCPSFESLRTEIMQLENELCSRGMLISDLTQSE